MIRRATAFRLHSAHTHRDEMRRFMELTAAASRDGYLNRLQLLMSYDVGPFLPRLLDIPTQVIVAEKDDLTLWDLEIEAYNRIPTAKKRLVVIGGSTHMTLYSDRSLLGEAALAEPARCGTVGRHNCTGGDRFRRRTSFQGKRAEEAT